MKARNDIYLAPKERFPEEPEETQELDPDEPSADEMHRADERAERMANRWNGGAQ